MKIVFSCSLAPIRGLIFDRNGVVLADNRPVFAVNLITERIDDLNEMLATLSELIEITDDDLEAFAKRKKRKQRPYAPVALVYNLTDDEVARVSVNRHRLPGVEIGTQMVRHYPLGELFAHAVGSVRRINERDLARLDPVAYSLSLIHI